MRFTRSGWLRLVGAIALPIAVLVSPAWVKQESTGTDTVRDWNLIAVNALANAANPVNAPAGAANPPLAAPCAAEFPTVAALHLAMVQGAVYDAVNAIDRGHQPYLTGLPPAPPSASTDAAAATAAHDVLVGLRTVPPVPSLCQPVRDQIDALYASSLAGISGSGKAAGIAAGAAAAKAMLDARTGDGRFVPFSFTPGDKPGQWRPTASGSDPFAWVGNVRPFLLQSPSQLRTKGPNALTSSAYAEEFAEVKALGSNSPTSARSPEQTAVALFYTERPDVLWNRTFRAIAEGKRLTLADEARLFAMLNTAGADGLISCWNDKAYWSFWRPVTAIRLADDDGNPATVADPNWSPLITNPPYPDHPSGYTCISSAFLHTAEAFFGRKKAEFTVHSNVTNVDRNYNRFKDAVKDVVDARVWEGIHFRTADVQADKQIGKRVARWLDKHYFQPVHKHHKHDKHDKHHKHHKH
jgi:hypothetical protein